MDAIVKPWPKAPLTSTSSSDHVRAAPQSAVPRPSREEAEAAVRTLIAFTGDYPDREGLLDTPKRVVDAYEELYRGYPNARPRCSIVPSMRSANMMILCWCATSPSTPIASIT